MVIIRVLGQLNERTPQSADDLEFIANYLHSSDEFSAALSEAEHWELYCLADGFGRLPPEELANINDGWDWSHIRDSSPSALAAIRARLEQILKSRN